MTEDDAVFIEDKLGKLMIKEFLGEPMTDFTLRQMEKACSEYINDELNIWYEYATGSVKVEIKNK